MKIGSCLLTRFIARGFSTSVLRDFGPQVSGQS